MEVNQPIGSEVTWDSVDERSVGYASCGFWNLGVGKIF